MGRRTVQHDLAVLRCNQQKGNWPVKSLNSNLPKIRKMRTHDNRPNGDEGAIT
jgi:hypothetical protein